MSMWLIVLPPEGAARQVGKQLIPAMKNQAGGDNLKVFDCKKYLNAYRKLLRDPSEDMVADLANQSLIIQCLEFEATHLLVLALSPVTLFTLNLLRKQGLVTIHWFFEDYRVAGYWRDVITGYDYFLGIQRGELMEFCRRSRTFFHFLPAAAGNEHSPLPAVAGGDQKSDLVFVGIPSPYRISALEALAASGRSLLIAGSQWDEYNGPLKRFIVQGSWVTEDRAFGLYRQAKIGLNLSVFDPGADRNNTHVSPRVFNILLSCLVLLTEEVALLKETLDGFHYHSFHSVQDLVKMTGEVLSRFPDYQKDCADNRSGVLARHTYQMRARQIVELTRK
ncbi:hypothetical protein ACFL5V_08825 [Fibrobacterota bacterium]